MTTVLEELKRAAKEADFTPFSASCPACGIGLNSPNNAIKHFEDKTVDSLHSQYSPLKEMTLQDLERILETSIKKDAVAKDVTFLDMLNAQTEDNQFNIMYIAESSSGKSYIVMQLTKYFPPEKLVILSGATPQSFVYRKGIRCREIAPNQFKSIEEEIRALQGSIQEIKLKPPGQRTQEEKSSLSRKKQELFDLMKNSVMLIDLEGKIVVFLDQANTQLLTKIRPLLSHDDKFLRFDLVNKNSRGANFTDNVVIKGFPVVIFCTANNNYDEQESTRNMVLSPEVDNEKIFAGVTLGARKKANTEQFNRELERNKERLALKLRVAVILSRGIKYVNTDPQPIIDKFVKEYPTRRPRDQRDIQRLFDLVYSLSLLNCLNRELSDGGKAIIASQSDIDNGFELFKHIMESNTYGVSPEVYIIYNEVIKPTILAKEEGGLRIADIMLAYNQHYGRDIEQERLSKDILGVLTKRGLVIQEKDPNDKRFFIYSLPLINVKKSQPQLEEKKSPFDIYAEKRLDRIEKEEQVTQIEVYQDYCGFCAENKVPPMSFDLFRTAISRKLKLKESEVVDGKRKISTWLKVRIKTREEEEEDEGLKDHE